VCFLVEAGGQRAVLTGDTILGRGTTIVAWPDGDLGDYLTSLARLTTLTGMPVLPGHGPPLADCAAAASYYLAHRRARLDQVRSAVAAGAKTPAEVVATVYVDIDRALRPAAEWSVRAQLAYLDRERRESHTRSGPLDSP
jgi:glyoxylase-like metal-dependent hydrolase (beta-lactamase superfamily II)